MKSLFFSSRIPCAAMLLFGTASLGASAVTLVDETFANGDKTGWYSTTSAAAGAASTAMANAAYDSGYALRFYSSSSNNAVATSFDAVTLAKAGDYIQASAVFRYTGTDPIATGNATGALVGLYNSNGSPLTADSIATPSPRKWEGWQGYKATKYALAGTNDMRAWGQDPLGDIESPFANWATGATYLGASSSDFVLARNVSYTTTFRIELHENLTDVIIAWSVVGGGESAVYTQTVTANTLTYDTLVLSAFSGWSGKDAYVGDIMVVSNVPEPGSAALLIGFLAAGLVWRASRRRNRAS